MIEILLVDDEAYVTESLAATIPWRELGVSRVHQAGSAAQALALLAEQSIDIVVTDIRMPEMDGLKLIALINESWPDVVCILLTGHSDFAFAKKAIQLQAFDYILKPVNDEELIGSVLHAIEKLKDDWEQAERYHTMAYNRKSDFSVLRTNLLHDLLLGRQLSSKTVADKLFRYEIPLAVDEPTVMLLLQLGGRFADLDYHSVQLMEYAIGNIAEEVFAHAFHVWHGKAPHDCLILVAAGKPEAMPPNARISANDQQRRAMLAETVGVLQKNVSNYLKGEISIFITAWFQFPDELAAAYRAGLSLMNLAGQADSPAVVFQHDQPDGRALPVKTLESLYKPPTLIHLLESKQWDAASQKIGEIFADVLQVRYSREHLYEIFLSVSNALMYVTHKEGRLIYQFAKAELDMLPDQSVIYSAEKLRDWSVGMLDKLRAELAENERYAKNYTIKQVQEIVSSELGQETSVKTIADRVYLHPVYLSKIYKMETGESLGDYIIRVRMERAFYLLKNTNRKIYEITEELGYQNPQYFSKIFKKHYGMTPNEFRSQ